MDRFNQRGFEDKWVVYLIGFGESVQQSLGKKFLSAGFKAISQDTIEGIADASKQSSLHVYVLNRHLNGVPNGGLKICPRLRRSIAPGTVIAMVGDVFEEHDRLLAYEVGADVVFSRSESNDYIVSRVTQLHRNVIPSSEDQLAMKEVIEMRAKLTRREITVCSLIMKGMSNKVIAYNLSVSEGAVKAHASSIYRKLSVRSRAELLTMPGLASIANNADPYQS